jgi:hypothetical protein
MEAATNAREASTMLGVLVLLVLIVMLVTRP